MLITAISVNTWIWFPFWLAIGLLFAIERVITAGPAGWRGRLLAAALLPELCYDLFLQAVFVQSIFAIALHR